MTRVRADLRRVPFARRSLDEVWAGASYTRLAPPSVPLALWDLHRAMAPGAIVHLEFVVGEADHAERAWPKELLDAVLEGAGFSIERAVAHPSGGLERLEVRARRQRTLADTVGPGMRLLLVGLNPSLVAADAGVGFHRAGNRAWPALLQSGLATVDRDPIDLLTCHDIGMTDLVKRASPRAGELTDTEYAHGIERLERICAWLRPDAVCVLGLTGWRRAVDPRAVAGTQSIRLGGRPVHLMPNPSGVNAHVTVDDLVQHLRAALAEADRHRVRETDRRAAP